MGDEELVSVSVAMRLLGVSSRTLRRYTQEGLLPDRRSPGGHRVFVVAELRALGRRRGSWSGPGGQVVLYGRVPSHQQQAEGGLERQVDGLRAAAGARPLAGVFTDIASGLSEGRRGLDGAFGWLWPRNRGTVGSPGRRRWRTW
ncbi:IS607 family transposase [Streptomyces sp. NPDC054863]